MRVLDLVVDSGLSGSDACDSPGRCLYEVTFSVFGVHWAREVVALRESALEIAENACLFGTFDAFCDHRELQSGREP